VEALEPYLFGRLERTAGDIGHCMIHLKLDGQADGALQILCLGCHSDDIEIGCGGTIMRLAAEYPGCVFHWVVFGAVGLRESEARRAAAQFVDASRLTGLVMKSFPDGFMPFVGADVKAVFEELKDAVSPELIFTHNRKDAHQDHRLIAELTWNTFRNHLILEYEIPKYDGDMGQPGVFVPLSQELCDRKVDLIMDAFRSQHGKHWFQRETFFSLMRLRGMECNSPSGYAEAFYGRKLVL
jgi:LmbE family N-acetylglucosaminyl deacetylase